MEMIVWDPLCPSSHPVRMYVLDWIVSPLTYNGLSLWLNSWVHRKSENIEYYFVKKNISPLLPVFPSQVHSWKKSFDEDNIDGNTSTKYFLLLLFFWPEILTAYVHRFKTLTLLSCFLKRAHIPDLCFQNKEKWQQNRNIQGTQRELQCHRVGVDIWEG